MQFLLFLLISPIIANASSSVEVARLAYRNGHYEKAAHLSLVAAAAQDPAAMALLGDLFREGRGVRQDPKTAYGWYAKAAEKDYIPSLYRIGVYLHEGYGTPTNAIAGLEKILKASSISNPNAQFDDATIDWIGYRASEEEDEHALFMLAKILQNGWGVIANEKGSIQLYAAAENHPLAQINLGALLLGNEDLRTPFEMFEKAADKGYAIAQYNLGLLFSRDLGPYRDIKRGRMLLEKAAAQEYQPAIKELAR
ncbi:MAG: hypothetical protein COB53_08545 [Elusimicrobia bacterium]|nr:MAG: hypothetical protein COB53_08545 [Elusimicrobiota bacterium]